MFGGYRFNRCALKLYHTLFDVFMYNQTANRRINVNAVEQYYTNERLHTHMFNYIDKNMNQKLHKCKQPRW